MSHPRPTRGTRSLAIALALALPLAAGPLAAPARGADNVRESTALKFVPADTSFFSARLRMRQQYEAVAGSKALARLLEIPAVQMARRMVAAQLEQPPTPELAEFWNLLKAPENKQLLELLGDAVSHEVFFCGGAGYAELMELLNEFSLAPSTAYIEAAKAGDDSDEARERRGLEEWMKLAGRLKVPSTLIGFKLSDGPRAEAQLARLEQILAAQLAMHPQFAGRLMREAIGGASFLTLRLDGTLIPWDTLPRENLQVDREQFERMINQLKKLTLTVSLGVRDGYLLLALGESNEHLKQLGQGELLIDRPELAPLHKHADKPLLTISYVSREFLDRANSVERQIDQYVRMAEELPPQPTLHEALRKELLADVRQLAQDVKQWVPRPGAVTGFSFLSPRGSEGYTYNWSEQPWLDGSQKLTILDRLGGQPLAFAAGRTKVSAEGYAWLAKWIRRAVYYGEQIALPKLEDEQRAIYERLRPELAPLADRLDQVIRNLWIPAFQDGQSALVIDAKLTSRQWHGQMPPAGQPLPMLEIGTVHAVSNAAFVKKAGEEVLDIAGQALKKLHAALPETVPEIPVPPPQSREFPEGTVYYYALPAEWGLDQQVAPNAGLSRDLLVLSLLPKFSLRLMQSSPLSAAGPLANRDRPLAAAGYCNWAGLIGAAAAWVDYGIDQAHAGDADVGGGAAESAKAIKAQVRVGLEFLQCLRGVSSVSYFEDDALVTHSEWHFEDQ
jgi:hypothetical protein